MSNLSALPSPTRAATLAPLTAATRLTPLQAMLAAACVTLCPVAQAQSPSQEPAYGFSGRIGLGVAALPTYEGSPNDRTLAAPELALTYRSHDWGTVELGPRGLFWNAFEAGGLRFALVAQVDLGRKDKDTSALNPTHGDKRLAGMGQVKSSTEAGVGIGYGPVMLVARQSLGDRGAKGVQADLTIEMPWTVSDRLGLRFALGTTWANRDYMQTYFGVTAAQAQATTFSVYTPKGGCRKVDASISAEYALTARWKLQGYLGVTQLGDEAAASPIVSRRNGTSAVLGVAYEF